MKRVLVTGSSGMVGSQAAHYFDQLGWQVVGIDNNLRKDFLGPHGDTHRTLGWLKTNTRHFEHQNIDIRSRRAIGLLMARQRFDLILHCAAQPCPELSRTRPLDDFDINAVGTMNLLEAARKCCPEAPLITLSSSDIYGEAPNEKPVIELNTRYDYARPEDRDGIDESCRTDIGVHGIFGAGKLAGDIMTLEYGRYFNMPTAVFRSSCLFGSCNRTLPAHGFLYPLVRTIREQVPCILTGLRSKQLRDPLHVDDLLAAIHAFSLNSRCGEVYNLGGGRGNSTSLLELIARLERISGKAIRTELQPSHSRGEALCYISNNRKFKSHFPQWSVTRNLDAILEAMLQAETIPPETPAVPHGRQPARAVATRPPPQSYSEYEQTGERVRGPAGMPGRNDYETSWLQG